MKPGVLWDRQEGVIFWMGGQVCESVCCFGWIWNFGIWAADQEFSSEGVREKGVGGLRVKDGSTGGQSEEGRDVCGGARMGCPSLSSSSLALLPPSCVQLLQLSDSSLTLSGSRRREFEGPLL